MENDLTRRLNDVISKTGIGMEPSTTNLILYGPVNRDLITSDNLEILKENEKLIKSNYDTYIFPKINGIVHRIDKDTSGILIIAKNNKEFEFLQKQFKERKIEKKYIALAVGEIKNNSGEIETLIGRSPKDRRKQKVFLINDPKAQGKRIALTQYTVLKRFKGYTLCEVSIKTGRKHQIRSHFSYIGYPIAGDKLYGFKGQLKFKRQFLHANYIKIQSIDNKEIEVSIELPEDLKEIIKNIKEYDN